MAIFSKHSADDDLPGDLSAVDSLPYGVEPPPVPRLAGLDLCRNVGEYARLGVPAPGHPSRPMVVEEAAVDSFNADMFEWSEWGLRQRAVLPALHGTATARIGHLEGECARLDNEIAAAEADVAAQRDELADPDRKFPRLSGAANGLVIAGVAVSGALEVNALHPVIGQVASVGKEAAWGLSIFAVTAIGTGAWLLGSVLHRAVTYEGPRRIRRVHTWAAAALSVFAIVALVAIVGMRVATRNRTVTTAHEAIWLAMLYAAMQGAVQLGSMVHGWWHNNPRVRQLASTEAHLDQLRGDKESHADALGQAQIWADSLNEFQVSEWLTQHRGQLANDYAGHVKEFRDTLELALRDAGQPEAADMLLILPLPKFVPPVEIDPGDSTDWLTGFMLPL